MVRETSGIVGDLKGLASTGVRAVRTRLERSKTKEEKAAGAIHRRRSTSSFGLLLAIFAVVLGVGGEPPGDPASAGILPEQAARPIYSLSGSPSDLLTQVLKGDEQGLQQVLRGTGD
jgi:hypothetical protein